MALFDNVLINLHRGFEKTKRGAQLFSERVKAEINIIRFRIKIDNIQAEIDKGHRMIGKMLLDLRENDELPKSIDKFLHIEDIARVLADIEKLKKELDEARQELENEQAAIKPAPEQAEDAA